jgi:hypothetical protein
MKVGSMLPSSKALLVCVAGTAILMASRICEKAFVFTHSVRSRGPVENIKRAVHKEQTRNLLVTIC